MYDAKMKNYLAPIQYLTSHFIYEYDISKANLNILFSKGVISEDDYKYILTFPRAQRQIYFGMMQKDKNIAQILNDGLAEYRQKFLETNQIPIQNLLSVKNDAMFLIDFVPQFTKFDNIEFVRKNTYTSFYHLGNLEIYYYLDSINDKEVIDIKGIDDKKLHLHENYMISLLCSIFEAIQTQDISYCMSFINDIINKYISKSLPIEFYREFNSDSMYRVTMPNGLQYLFQTINDKDIQYLNIITNLNLLRDLYSIISNIYFTNKK